MKQLFYTLLLSVFLFSCSDDDKNSENEIPGNFKTVKIVLSRTSSDHSLFLGGTILTIPIDRSNTQYNAKDFDSVLDNVENILLSKLNNPVGAKQVFTIKQKKVNIQVLDTPQLQDEIESEDFTGELKTTIEIFVNDILVKEGSFLFDSDGVNLNLIQYSEK